MKEVADKAEEVVLDKKYKEVITGHRQEGATSGSVSLAKNLGVI